MHMILKWSIRELFVFETTPSPCLGEQIDQDFCYTEMDVPLGHQMNNLKVKNWKGSYLDDFTDDINWGRL